MAGVKGQKSGNRTPGPRQGAPKKTVVADEKLRREWRAAARRYKAKHGRRIEDDILDMVADTSIQSACRIGAAKLYAEIMLAKPSQLPATAEREPPITIPARRPDPALHVVKKTANE